MKKLLLILGMITSLAMVTACGSKVEEVKTFDPAFTQELAEQQAAFMLEQLNYIAVNKDTAEVQQVLKAAEKDPVTSSAIASFESALEDLGDYQEMKDCTFEQTEDGVTILANIKGSEKTGSFELILNDEFMMTSATTNVDYTFGELMTKAGLNTLMGMGTVFVVLILIAWLISLFAFIPKIQAAFSKKENKSEASVEKAVAQIVENETVQEDDTELVAVIAAAIAAYEGSGSADNYVVRSIRRR